MKKYYEILINGIPESLTVANIVRGVSWIGAELSDGRFGIAMSTEGEGIGRTYPTLIGLDAKTAAGAVMSWNMAEASEAMAVINAYYNTKGRMLENGWNAPFERICTRGMEVEGKTVAYVGHLRLPLDTVRGAKKLYILERREIAGDYPDAACEYLLPECDIVIITGSASVNKTMPRLLELSEKAKTILIGPTVPMCPELLNAGIDRLSGMVVKDKKEFMKWMTECSGNPYPYGHTFMIG